VSGFFGSGKSSFAKLLGLHSTIGPSSANQQARRSGTYQEQEGPGTAGRHQRTDSNACRHLRCRNRRGILSPNQRLTEIMYRLLLESLGYARDLDLAELEITLEGQGKLAEFEARYEQLFEKSWASDKNLVVFSVGRASHVVHLMDKAFSAPESWWQSAKKRADVTPRSLAERAKEVMARRRPARAWFSSSMKSASLLPAMTRRMLDLQTSWKVSAKSVRGKMWLVATSQERLDAKIDDFKGGKGRVLANARSLLHRGPS